MYLHLELKTMATNRLAEAVERLHLLHSLMATAPGFVSAQICQYLGNPGRYLVVRTWTDGSAHAAFRQTAPAREFAASRPAGFIYDNLAVQEWQRVLDTPGTTDGDYLVRRLHSIEPAGWEAFVSERRQLDAVALRSGGVAGLRTFRMLANEKADDTKAFILERWASRDAYLRFLESPHLAEFQRQARFDGSELIECYQIEDEVLPSG
jgi:quinol monooxygenase YgiN